MAELAIARGRLGERKFLGGGLEVIWWLASVIPYASNIGAPYAASHCSSSAGERAELHERTKRSVWGTGAPSRRSSAME